MSTIISDFLKVFRNLFCETKPPVGNRHRYSREIEVCHIPYIAFYSCGGMVSADLQLFIGGMAAHGAIVIRLVCCHIKVAGTGQTEQMVWLSPVSLGT